MLIIPESAVVTKAPGKVNHQQLRKPERPSDPARTRSQISSGDCTYHAVHANIPVVPWAPNKGPSHKIRFAQKWYRRLGPGALS